MLDIFKIFIGFNIISCEFNLGFIEWVCDFFECYGVIICLIYDVEWCKVNFFVILGDVGFGCFGIVFFGYIDVVLVKGQNWDIDFFVVYVVDGKLFGCGVCDMKGFIVVCLVCLLVIVQDCLYILLYFLFFYDEEVGCLGVCELLVDLQQNDIKFIGVIIGEFIMMQFVIVYKGKCFYCCLVYGYVVYLLCLYLGINSIDYVVMM